MLPAVTAAARVDALAAAAAMAAEFRADAAERDLAAGTPWAQRERIKASGLLLLMVPAEYGGLGGDWPTTLRCVREIATADASLAHLFGYHHLGVITPHLIGTPEQRAHWYSETARGQLFWGNALNPLDPRTRLTRSRGSGFKLNGTKSFCTGAQGSDLLITSATLEGVPQLQVAVLPTQREGITVHDDWANMGQRQTDSGSVSYADVTVDASELLGPPGAGGSVFASLRPCMTQAILSNIFLGTAQGALLSAREYTLALERPFAGSMSSSPAEDPYVLQHYGEMSTAGQAAACLLDSASSSLQQAWLQEDALTAQQRGECAALMAAAKVMAGRTALDVTSRIFEVMGARATSERYRFDRFWRNVRTLTLHDPLDYKAREVGDFYLNGRVPTPSFYS
jgi:alkylation response protein AidB-like acyl-CoA dehydrogenase